MKKPATIIVGFGLAVATAALAISLLPAPGRVSMAFVEYKRWPHGALLRLTNGTQTTVTYLAEDNGTPSGNPILSLQKTPNGWTNTSPTVRSAMAFDQKTETEFFFLTHPGVVRRVGDPLAPLLTRELKSGRIAEFFVRLEPDAYPQRIGIVCCVQQNKLAGKLHRWLFRIKQWCRIEATLPGQIEIWCPKPLIAVGAKPQIPVETVRALEK